MKASTTLTLAASLVTLIIMGCNEKKTTVPHDHDGDGIPDHGPGAHGKPVPHDHDGDGKPDHGPGAHNNHSNNDHGHDHGHDHAEKVAGPNGGKIITAIEPHAEFFVTDDRKVRITFLDDDHQPIAVANPSVSIVCGDRSNPTTLTLTKEAYGMSMISDNTLPTGNNFPTIVTFKNTPDATPVRAKFTLNLSDCPSCTHKEYACTCEHAHE
ncbi:MAG: hypothetical protein KJO21_08690 [Verrucomicrobiae bacterium]|nr:hypothetical protein [Verrucomicrobiae bacterium]NNJ42414.1 hypothetical protein [Akkermansiaceae bacterium]